MYTSLFLDLDNTLLDFNAAEAHAVRKVLKSHGLPHDDAAVALYSDINRSYWERFERGEIPREAIFEGRFKPFLRNSASRAIPQKFQRTTALIYPKGILRLRAQMKFLNI